MRVVLATTGLIRGGVWRHMEDLARTLGEQGHEVVIALAPEASQLRQAAGEAGLPVADLDDTVNWRKWIWHAHLGDTVDRYVARAVILPRSHATDANLLPGPRRPFARQAKTLFKRVQIACADAVIAVSGSSAAFMSERYGVAPDRIAVVFNGLRESEELKPVGREMPEPVPVVAVGSVIYQKGHDLLLSAAAQSRGGWTATVVGEGKLRTQLADQAVIEQLPIRFAGWVEDPRTALATAEIACMPSRWESCPYAALEAMAAGRPLVGTDVDGVRDLVDHESTGLLVPAEDAFALARALDRLAADPKLRRRMGEAAARKASGFTVHRMGTETVAVYVAACERFIRLRFTWSCDPRRRPS